MPRLLVEVVEEGEGVVVDEGSAIGNRGLDDDDDGWRGLMMGVQGAKEGKGSTGKGGNCACRWVGGGVCGVSGECECCGGCVGTVYM